MDTAEIYAVPPSAASYGKTETIIGTWLKASGKRDRIILATKVAGGGTAWIRNGRRADGPSIREALEGSLKRLQTDYIDLYQIHAPWRGHYHFENYWSFHPERQDNADVAATCSRLPRNAWRAGEGGQDPPHRRLQRNRLGHHAVPASSANSMACRGWLRCRTNTTSSAAIFDHDLAEVAHHEDVGLLAYSPLAAGVLTGKYLDGAMPAGSRGDVSNGIWRMNRHSEPAIRAYLELAREHGSTSAQMAIAFCLTRPFMTSVIIGATNGAQLTTNIDAAALTLPPELLASIDDVHRRHPRPI